jgi:HEAT repeat protein
LAVAVERTDRPEAALAAWLEETPSPDAVASAAFGLRGLDVSDSIMTSYVRYGLEDAESFTATWRLIRSAGAAGSDARIDAWVESQLSVDEPWMLRAAAVEAAAERGSRDAVRANLEDSYPRVRMRAAAVLSGDSTSMIARATLARKDAWPMVRAEAVRSLRSEPDALPVVIAAVNDSMSVVRASAIDVLTHAPHDEGWDRVHARLRADNEWPVVTEAAIAYVVAHCRTDAAESLFRVVMRAAPSNALTDDLNNAARAIEALRVLGTPEANAVVERLRATPGVPPTLKMALDAPAPERGRCVVPES